MLFAAEAGPLGGLGGMEEEEEVVVEAGGVAAVEEDGAPTAGDMDLLWVELVEPLGEGGGRADAAAVVTFAEEAVVVELDEGVVVVSLVSEAEVETVEPSGPVWKQKSKIGKVKLTKKTRDCPFHSS